MRSSAWIFRPHRDVSWSGSLGYEKSSYTLRPSVIYDLINISEHIYYFIFYLMILLSVQVRLHWSRAGTVTETAFGLPATS